MSPDWLENVLSATDRLFSDTLGPEITDDMRDLCPVFGGENSTATPVSLAIAASLGDRGPEPGALRDSIEHHLNGHDLVVSATGSDERSWAYWVEYGHAISVFGRSTGRHKPATPFIRPAIYRVRTPG
jgi:hypothetical protein